MKNLKQFGRRSLALVLTFVMCMSMLQLTAFAADGEAVSVHEHNQNGWTCIEHKALTCGFAVEHTHDDETCYQDLTTVELTCGMEESEGHVHTDECYKTDELICEQEESEGHTHGDDCYTIEVRRGDLICELEESEDPEGHHHDDSCYQSVEFRTLTCELEESEGHQHSDACYAKSEEPCCRMEAGEGAHTHVALGETDSCYTKKVVHQLICTLDEHTHNETCYGESTWDCTPPVTVTVTSVELQDTIFENGCLTAVAKDADGKVLTEGVTYQWYDNGKAIDGATGSQLSAFAPGEDPQTAKVVILPGHVYTVLAKANGNADYVSAAGSYTGVYYDSFQNGSFESPTLEEAERNRNSTWYVGGKSDILYSVIIEQSKAQNFYWKTTAEDNCIEVFNTNSTPAKESWSTGHRDEGFYHFPTDTNPQMPDGDQAAELNANYDSALYQEVLTQPESTIHWSLYHRGRLGTDTMNVLAVKVDKNGNEIGTPEILKTSTEQTDISTNNTGWVRYEGRYEVPEGQYLTRFYFKASGASGGSSQGNLLDYVNFGRTYVPPVDTPDTPIESWTIEYYVNGKLDKSEKGQTTVGSVITPSKLGEYEDYCGPFATANETEVMDKNACKLHVTKNGDNILKLYFTKEITPPTAITYNVEWYAEVGDSFRLMKSQVRQAEADDDSVEVWPADKAETFTSYPNFIFDQWNDGNVLSLDLYDEDDELVENPTLKLYFAKDAIGENEDPDTPDGIPDKYQRVVTYKVANGAWNDGSKADVTKVVTLRDEAGNPSVDGSAAVAAITDVGEKPDTNYLSGYKAENWDSTFPATVKADSKSVFTYEYKPDSSKVWGLRYTVEYYKDNEIVAEDTQNVTVTAPKFDEDRNRLPKPDVVTVDWTGIDTKNDKYEGFSFDRVDPADEPETVADGSTIKVYYVSIPAYTLTVNYVYADGTTAAPTVIGEYREGVSYNVSSPVISGYTVDIPVVAGTMPARDVAVTVTYTPVPAATYTLTINYRYADGSQAAEPYFEEGLHEGDAYSVTSPVISGYTADNLVVDGVMPGADQIRIVTYSSNYVPPYTPDDGGDDDGGDPYIPTPSTTPTPSTPVTPDTPEVTPPEVTIPDEDVPMAETPEVIVPDEDVPLAEIPEVVIPDEDVPLAEIPEVVIPDEDVPLAEIPEVIIPDEDVPLAEIPEALVPLAEVPKTGDNAYIWAVLAISSGAGLAWLALDEKKRRADAE